MKQLFFLLGFCLLFFSSCIDILEELHLNKDGSGKYAVTMDMSALMEFGNMKDMLNQMGGEEGEVAPVPDDDEPIEMDTLMYFKDAPDSVKQKLSDPKLAEKAFIKMQMSDANKKMIMTFGIDFEKVSDIDHFLKNIDKLQGDNPASGMLGNGGGGFFPNTGAANLFKYGKKYLERLPIPKPDSEELSDEDMQMMQMMFADANYTTIYHFPGKVKKTTIPNAVVDGKTLSLSVPLMDVMEGKAKMEGITKFKKR